jgi:hypothetical protein
MTHDIGRLEAQLYDLRDAIAQLGDGEAIGEVLLHIHRPGWTTPVEYELISEMVATARAQVDVVRGLAGAIASGARQIGTHAPVGAAA